MVAPAAFHILLFPYSSSVPRALDALTVAFRSFCISPNTDSSRITPVATHAHTHL